MASEPTAQICPGCGTTVDTTDAEPLARIACPTCGKKIRVERAFDHFVVVETLGVGGMGTVYKACDTQLGRFVALKLLRRDLGGEEDRKARLQQEVRRLARSLNTINSYDYRDVASNEGSAQRRAAIDALEAITGFLRSQGTLLFLYFRLCMLSERLNFSTECQQYSRPHGEPVVNQLLNLRRR